MATVTYHAAHTGIDDIREYYIAVGATVAVNSSTEYTIVNSDGSLFRITGIGFSYNGSGDATGGTITGAAYTSSGGTEYWTITGLTAPRVELDENPYGYLDLIFDESDIVTVYAVGTDSININIPTAVGNDTVFGGSGNDNIQTDVGDDTIFGNGGNDYLQPGSGVDSIDGGDGYDALVYAHDDHALSGIVATFTSEKAGTVVDWAGDTDTFTNIEELKGTNFDDVLTGHDGRQSLRGQDGNDIINGLGGDDDLSGGDGDDILNGGDGDDYLQPGVGVDTIDGGDGYDTLAYAHDDAPSGIVVNFTSEKAGTVVDWAGDTDTFINIESVKGTDEDDVLIGHDGEQQLRGRGGNDIINGLGGDDNLDGGYGDDTLNGGDGDDYLQAGAGTDTIDGGAGYDTLAYAHDDDATVGITAVFTSEQAGFVTDWAGDTDTFTNIEEIKATDFDDVLLGDDGAQKLRGRGGDDDLAGYDGDDRLQGDEGNDTLDGGAGDDVLEGGAGDDTMTGGADFDQFFFDAGHGADTITDFETGSGGDVIDFASGYGFTFDYIMENATQNGDDTIIDFGNGDSITFLDLDKDDLSEDDFWGLYNGMEVTAYAGEPTLNMIDVFETFGTNAVVTFANSDGYELEYNDSGDIIKGVIQGEDFAYSLTELTGGTAYSMELFLNGDLIFSIQNANISYQEINQMIVDMANRQQSAVWDLDKITYIGSDEDDIFYAGNQDDELKGGEGSDTLYGGDGDDYIRGDESGTFNQGDDFLYGGNGNDNFKGGDGADYIDGGDGEDRVDYNSETDFTGDDATHGVIVNLSDTEITGVSVAGIASTNVAAGTAIDTRNNIDTLVSIERIWGTEYDDYIVGRDGQRNELESHGGNNTIIGGDQNDYIRTGDGDDIIYAQDTGELRYGDFIMAGSGTNIIYGSAVFFGDGEKDGHDLSFQDIQSGVTVDLNTGLATATGMSTTFTEVHFIVGSGFDDVITGGVAGFDRFEGYVGNKGDDVIDGGSGFDEIRYGFETRNGYFDSNGDQQFGFQGVTVNLATGTATDSYGDTDTLISIESIRGTEYNDTITGDEFSNDLRGENGDDVIHGGDGDDVIWDGQGTDQIFGEGGDDLLINNGGYNELFDGGAGNDTLHFDVSLAGNSDYTVYFNTITGKHGTKEFVDQQDTIVSIENFDFYGGWNTEVHGGAEDNKFYTDSGNDKVYSGDGDDIVKMWGGDDYAKAGGGANSFDGGSGVDTISYYDSVGGVKLNLATNSASKGDAADDIVMNFENVNASLIGDDHITGTSGANYIKTYGGNDKVYAGAGDDIVKLGSGDDYVKSGGGADYFDGGSGVDTISYYDSVAGVKLNLAENTASKGDAADDTVKNFENVNGSHFGNDHITGTSGANYIKTYEGNDKVYSGDGDDIVKLGGGDDYAKAGGGANSFDGGSGVDTVSYYDSAAGVKINLETNVISGGDAADDTIVNFENVNGSLVGNDKITGTSGANYIKTYGGNDKVYSGDGDDIVKLGDGDDYAKAGGGANSFDGGDGVDTISYYDSAVGVKINLETNVVSGGDAADDTVIGFENVNASLLGNDKITGTSGANYIKTYGGNDKVYSGDGDDTVKLGDGDDYAKAGGGANSFDGGSGVDTISYYDSAVGVKINLETNVISGGDADDDSLTGFENVNGSLLGNDKITGTSGANYIKTYGGNDKVYSGDGDDIVRLGAGDDYAKAGGGANDLDGGSGVDTVSYYDSLLGVKINLDTNVNSGGDAADDTLSGFENVNGSSVGNDHITGTDGANYIKTYGGNDKVYAGLGDDIVKLGDGDDYVKVGGGAEYFDGGAGVDTISYYDSVAGVKLNLADNTASKGDAADDTVKNFENVNGSLVGNDHITGNADANYIKTYGGNDKVYAGAGDDIVKLGAGDDYVRVGGGAEYFDGGSGVDTISYYDSVAGVKLNLADNTASKGDAADDTVKNFENVNGSLLGNDHITGNADANYIKTYGGNDKVYAGAGDNIVKLGAGDDYVKVGGGAEYFDGGDGVDTISYYDSADGVKLNLATNSASLGDAADDTVKNFENVNGSLVGNDHITGTDGANYIKTYGGNDKVYGGGGDDLIKLGDGDDIGKGGGGVDTIYGGDGEDFFDGGSGDDILFGGSGADTFHYDFGEDHDTIKDFENNIDTIELDNSGYANVAEALTHATQVGNDVVFDFGGSDGLTVEDVTISQLVNDLLLV